MHKKHKIIFIIAIVTILSLYVRFFGYYSTENTYKRLQGRELVDWYYNISLTTKGANKGLSIEEKNTRTQIARSQYSLGTDWDFVLENIDFIEIDSYSGVIDLTRQFRNSKTKEVEYFYTRYYYEVGTPYPIPLSERSWLEGTERNPNIKTLWGGDFSAIFIKSI